MNKALVIINPKSGRGKSINTYNKFKMILEELFNCEILITKYSKHVYDYFTVNATQILDKDLIITIGGDGITHEVINSLMKKNIQIPVAEIPSGSSNGYFKSLVYSKNLKFSPENAIRIIKDFSKKKVDIMKINNLDIYSRLSISWGFISNVDIYTEWMRPIGSVRFDLGAVWNVLKKPSYYGTLEYTNHDNSNIKIGGNFIYFWACNTSHASHDIMSSPNSKLDDGLIHISYILDNVSRFELTKILLALSSGKFIEHPKVKYIAVKEFKLKTKSGLIVVDGEPVYEKNINVSIIPDKLEILC